ncbi:hypothetical protein KW478_22580 [Vibrio fluvialis]|nr:hypothetical protein [Vibrio fluvialis]
MLEKNIPEWFVHITIILIAILFGILIGMNTSLNINNIIRDTMSFVGVISTLISIYIVVYIYKQWKKQHISIDSHATLKDNISEIIKLNRIQSVVRIELMTYYRQEAPRLNHVMLRDKVREKNLYLSESYSNLASSFLILETLTSDSISYEKFNNKYREFKDSIRFLCLYEVNLTLSNKKEIVISMNKVYPSLDDIPDNILPIIQRYNYHSNVENTGIKLKDGEYVNFLNDVDLVISDIFQEVLKLAKDRIKNLD